MAADGLPASIPLPGSRLPTVRDWKQHGQAIRVGGAEELGCQAKMIREWIRLTCKADGGELGKPEGAETKQQAGAPAYIFAQKDKAVRLETQLVPGRTYQAELTWHDGKRIFEIRWPKGKPRPQVHFTASDADAQQTDEQHDGKKHDSKKHKKH